MRTHQLPAFTLVELLVVISIIAVLIGLLMPSLKASRDAALVTRCNGNLRQIGTPLAMYSDANKEWLPTPAYSHDPAIAPDAPNWAGNAAHIMGVKYITEYTRNSTAFGQNLNQSTLPRLNGIFQCPADRYAGYFGANLASTSYGWNDASWGLGRNDVFLKTSLDLARARRNTIKIPSDTIMIGDWTRGVNPANGRGYYYEYQPGQFNGITTARNVILHDDNINILWADGRATTRNKYTLVAADWDRRD